MRTPTWVLGYHGCDRTVGEAVLAGRTTLRSSANDWDWLGTGIYFWENNARRAMDWAEDALAHPQFFSGQVKEPFVIGAVIDLGNCLNLLEATSIQVVQEAHERMRRLLADSGSPPPMNAGAAPDRIIRRLDCAVINYVHAVREEQDREPFDSVRAAFIEGKSLYEGAGFHARTHIQICVRREPQIVGYFRVREMEQPATPSPAKSPPARRPGARRAARRKGG